jgi:D-amino-acid oxidase
MRRTLAGLQVAVIGCGVSGLTCGIRLLERHCAVTIMARDLPPQTTSDAAAAFWFPFKAYPEDRVLPWAQASLVVLSHLATQPGSGVSLMPLSVLAPQPFSDPWWISAVPTFRRLSRSEIPTAWQEGYQVNVPLMDTPLYMRYLQQRFTTLGGHIRRATVRHPTDLAARYPIIVNCSGIGARHLVDDPQVYPIRGQVVRIRKPASLAPEILDIDLDGADLTYIVPRHHDCLLGGTAEAHDWELTARTETARQIIARCAALRPVLHAPDILEHKVGLRPGRSSVRVECQPLSTTACVIHNYGHGGAGFTLSWGCAAEVVRLLEQFYTAV